MPPPVKSRTSRLKPRGRGAKAGKLINRLLENRLINRLSDQAYRDEIRKVYDGPQGAILATCSFLSLHTLLGPRMMREGMFDLRGAKRILDVGSGAGQISRQLLKCADRDARLTCFDLSHKMLQRARGRLRSDRPGWIVADATQLPFADAAFDCVTCGYVLEHVPDVRRGLAEISRVMAPGARMLLLTTEDNFAGALTSAVWHCRTYNRRDLRRICEELELRWVKELWYTRTHKILRAGGICVEIRKSTSGSRNGVETGSSLQGGAVPFRCPTVATVRGS
jgi:ubiquinone/menaquinone biosynthesis C-methylase UbiE